MIASFLSELKWYHVAAIVCGLLLIVAAVACLTYQECRTKRLPLHSDEDIV